MKQPPGPRFIGPHTPLGGGMVKAADRARAIGASAIQVFGDNPTAWRRRAEPPRESEAFRDRLVEHEIGPVAIHAAYLINLAGPERDFFERSIEVLRAELQAAWAFSGRLVNVHVGSHRDTSLEVGIARVAEGIERVLADRPAPPDGPQLVLENAAGGGWAVGVRLDELAEIAVALERRGIARERVAFCLDTAHLWGAGYDIGQPERVDELLADFDAWIGLDRLAMIHLNDSKAPLGSRIDRHEHIGAGLIGHAGLAHLLREPRLAEVPFYLETPGMDLGYDAINLARARELAAGRRLKPLPAEALALKRSRGRARPRVEPSDEQESPASDAASPGSETATARTSEPVGFGSEGATPPDSARAETGLAAAARRRSRR